MKICPNCKIEVGGSASLCPLCRHRLTGEDDKSYWPPLKATQTMAFLYKLQLLIVLIVIAVSLILDFRLELNSGPHWSLVAAAWGILGEWLVQDFIKHRLVITKLVTVSIMYICLLLWLTSMYLGFMDPIVRFVLPILISLAIIANFVFAMIDRYMNSTMYLFTNILMSVIPYVVLSVTRYEGMLSWTICLMIAIAAFLGIIVFRGKKVVNEIQRRMNI